MRHSAPQRPLGAGYSVDVDSTDQNAWHNLLRTFSDSNIYQTWSYGEVIYGNKRMTNLILRYGSQVVAVAQGRIVTVPLLGAGIAYFRWAPLWRLTAATPDFDVLRQALRALRNEYVCKRGLNLRIRPLIFEDQASAILPLLSDEGFAPLRNEPPKRTILMDLTPPLDALRAGMKDGWRKTLKAAERHSLEVAEGVDEHLFESFISLYKKMVARKRFLEPNDIEKYRLLQARLPNDFKMRVSLSLSEAGPCAGHIWSEIGQVPLTLFMAAGDLGLKNGASYILKWRMLQKLRERGFAVYNLNGINATTNPGSYYFKSGAAGRNGREIEYIGVFEARGSALSSCAVRVGESLRTARTGLRMRAKAPRS